MRSPHTHRTAPRNLHTLHTTRASPNTAATPPLSLPSCCPLQTPDAVLRTPSQPPLIRPCPLPGADPFTIDVKTLKVGVIPPGGGTGAVTAAVYADLLKLNLTLVNINMTFLVGNGNMGSLYEVGWGRRVRRGGGGQRAGSGRVLPVRGTGVKQGRNGCGWREGVGEGVQGCVQGGGG